MPGTEALRNLICHTHKLIVVVNINHTARIIIPMVGACQKWGGGGALPPHFSEWGGDRPPCPPYVSTPVIVTSYIILCMCLLKPTNHPIEYSDDFSVIPPFSSGL